MDFKLFLHHNKFISIPLSHEIFKVLCVNQKNHMLVQNRAEYISNVHEKF